MQRGTLLLLLSSTAATTALQLAAGVRTCRCCCSPTESLAISMGLLDSIIQAFDEIESTSDRKSAVASHILVKSRADALALKEALDLGEMSFSDAAKRYSSCPSAGTGGSLGQFSEGQMAPAFDALVFDPDTEVGAINVCSTSFGTHLVKVIERFGVQQTEPAELEAKAQAAEAAAAAAAAAAMDPIRAAAEAAAAAAEAAVAAAESGDDGPQVARPASARQRLAELSELLSAELITKEEFDTMRKAVIDSI